MSIDPVTAAKTVGTAAESLSKIQKIWRWWNRRRYPKPPINHFGIVVGITTENDKQRAQVRSDFVNTLKQLLKENTKLVVLELPETLAAKIHTETDAVAVLEKTESVFLLFGAVRQRNIQKQSMYVLDLRSAVIHSHIAMDVHQRFAKEMAELLPIRRLISASNDLVEFELNAISVDIAARYVISVAAYLSNQRTLAIQLTEQLNERLEELQKRILPASVQSLVKTLKERAAHNLLNFHLNEGLILEYQWRKTRDIKFLENMTPHLAAADSYRPNTYGAVILRALYVFVKDRNVREARKLLIRCPGRVNDATWAFDMAFFYAYEGKLTKATSYYKMAFQLSTDSGVIVEIEEFLLWVLSEEPDKIQLHYCVGMVNYFAKQDFMKAKEDFQTFLELTEDSKRFPKERKQVENYVEEIERKNLE